MANKAGYVEQYKDVIHEDVIRVACTIASFIHFQDGWIGARLENRNNRNPLQIGGDILNSYRPFLVRNAS